MSEEEDSMSMSGDDIAPDPDDSLRKRIKFNYVLFVARNIVSSPDKFDFNLLNAYNFQEEDLKNAHTLLVQDALEANITLTNSEKKTTGNSQRTSTIVKNLKAILNKVKNWDQFPYYIPRPDEAIRHFSTSNLEKELSGCANQANKLRENIEEARTILSKAQQISAKRPLSEPSGTPQHEPPNKTFRDIIIGDSPRPVLTGTRRNRSDSVSSAYSMFSDSSRKRHFSKQKNKTDPLSVKGKAKVPSGQSLAPNSKKAMKIKFSADQTLDDIKNLFKEDSNTFGEHYQHMKFETLRVNKYVHTIRLTINNWPSDKDLLDPSIWFEGLDITPWKGRIQDLKIKNTIKYLIGPLSDTTTTDQVQKQIEEFYTAENSETNGLTITAEPFERQSLRRKPNETDEQLQERENRRRTDIKSFVVQIASTNANFVLENKISKGFRENFPDNHIYVNPWDKPMPSDDKRRQEEKETRKNTRSTRTPISLG